MIEQGAFINLGVFLLICIVIQYIIKKLNKGDGAMKEIVSSTLEVLQTFSIGLVASATLSLR